MKRILSCFGMALFVCACSSRPSLTVQIATGLVPGPEFVLVTTELIENGVSLDAARTLEIHETAAAFGQAFARGRRVTTFDSIQEGQHTVRVRLYRPDGTLLIQHRTRVNVGSDFVLTVHLTRDCVGVMCPNPGGSAAFSECLAGRCVTPDCTPTDRSTCADVVFCNAPADCGPTSSCAAQTCTEGICHPESIDEECLPTEWCDPDPTGGCLPGLMPTDAGVIEDAGTDASIPTDANVFTECGRACTPAGQPCVAGFWDCSGAEPVCARLGQRTTGTECADGSVCNGFGACVACRADEVCRIGCAMGHVSCARGTEECELDEPAAIAPVATSCGTSTQCIGDDACGSGDICSDTGTCTPCANGAPCVDGCARGTVDCAAGALCVPNDTYLAMGALCGTDQRCTAEHECVECIEYAVCESTDPCQTLNVSCHLGAPTCYLTGGLPAGSSCGTDSVCDWNYTCQHCVVSDFCTSVDGCSYGFIDDCTYGPSCSLFNAYDPGMACPTGVCSGTGSCYPDLIADFVDVSGTFACALLAGGTVSCWGGNTYGELGRGYFDYMAPENLNKIDIGLTDIVALSVGNSHACAVSESGSLWCWGANYDGSLGNGGVDPVPSPTLVTLMGPATAVAASSNHTCALLADGHVQCSGAGAYIGTGDGVASNTFVAVSGITDAVQIAVSGASTCARLASGSIQCWGANSQGELGDAAPITSDPYASYVPVDVLTIDDAVDVAIGGNTGCAVRADGELWCWGQGGEPLFLDPGAPASGAAPTHVPLAFDDVVDVEVGYSRICVLRAAGEMLCWGDNSSGQLGVGSYDPVTDPTNIAYFSDVVQASITQGASSCIRRASGQVACFGDNSWGQLGDGSYNGAAYPVIARRN
ncbi:MAG: hypothetical protein IPK60_05710 [Sandaracinaceae bacterium]|nr:hypothetical protein [Sandaracinaceae bacterium]